MKPVVAATNGKADGSRSRHFLVSIFKKLWIVFAVSIIFLAVLSSAFRAMTPWAKQYKSQVEQHISAFLGKKVIIGDMETVWYWFEPLLKLEQVKVFNADGTEAALSVNKLLIGLNFFHSLWHRQLQPDIIYADGVKLSLRQTLVDNQVHWHIEGLNHQAPRKASLDAKSYHEVLLWTLTRQKIIFKNVSGTIYYANQTQLPIKRFDLYVLQGFSHYKVKADTYLKESKEPYLALKADVVPPSSLEDLPKLKAKAYLAANDFNFAELQGLLPKSNWILQQGRGSFALWLDWQKGSLQNAQAKVQARALLLHNKALKKNYGLPFLSANAALLQSKDSWELTADHLQMVLEGKRWPENKILLRLQKNQQKLSIYVKELNFAPMLDLLFPWFKALGGLKEYKPEGVLLDTQVNFTKGQADYLLTRFSKLRWSPLLKVPGVENLQGVLHWQANEGQLELDAKNVLLRPLTGPIVPGNNINLSLFWKQLSHGMRIDFDNLLLENAGLLLSARGSIDEVTKSSLGFVNLALEVSAKQSAKIFEYVPSAYWQSPLGRWIQQNIPNPGSLTSEIKIQGQARDFPFEEGQGEFKINAHLRDVDFIFAKNWPLTKAFEAYLQVDKRKLDVDVVHAELKDIEVSNANFRIEEMGKGRESLLLHTKIEALLQQVYDYFKASPLAAKIKNWQQFQAEGNIHLDLNLELPMYPENKEILALGELRFNENQIKAELFKLPLALDALNGTLRFDGKSLLDGNLSASFMDYPLTASIESNLEPTRLMRAKLHGKTSMDVLGSKIDYPLFALMKGEFWFDALLELAYLPKGVQKNLQIQSSLQGVGIHLPEPFNKPEEKSLPVALSLSIMPDNGLRFGLNYNHLFRSDLWFVKKEGKMLPTQGEIRLGEEGSLQKPAKGVQVLGRLSILNTTQWQKILEEIPLSELTRRVIAALNKIDVLIDKVDFAHRQYANTRIKAYPKGKQEWALDIQQKDIQANLHYFPESNAIKGQFSKLHLDKFEAKAQKNTNNHWAAKNLPTIDWDIQALEYGDLALGQASLQGNPEKDAWRLKLARIKTDFYDIMAEGLWSGAAPNEHSHLEALMHIKNLAKALAFWNISPVVNAEKGRLNFKGEWQGAFHDFSLKTVQGHLSILLQNGQISNLSPDTEKKLGLGKLLSILSLQTLPRRLKLDFSDLSSKGYSFDEFKGNFAIENGLMTTKDSFINGPIAYVAMTGSLDISRQLYEMTLKVTPYVTASLPIVATIAGGPVAGIATWVASKIINKGMQKVTGYTYKITGPWKQPVVQQAGISKK